MSMNLLIVCHDEHRFVFEYDDTQASFEALIRVLLDNADDPELNFTKEDAERAMKTALELRNAIKPCCCDCDCDKPNRLKDF